MARGGVIFNPDVQSDIDMKNTYKLINYPSSTGILNVAQTIYVDAVNGSAGGARGTTAAFQTLAQAIAVAQSGDIIEIRSNLTYTGAITLSVPLVLDFRNHVITPSAQTDSQKLIISADGCQIRNAEFNGIWDGTTVGGNGSVITGSTKNCLLENIYIHDSISDGIDWSGDFSNSVTHNVRVSNCRLAGLSFSSNSVLVSNPTFSKITVTNAGSKGIGIFRGGSETNQVSGVKLSEFYVDGTGGATQTEAVYLHGLTDFTVSNGQTSNSAFNISIDTSSHGSVENVLARGGRTDQYCGLELAWCQHMSVSNSVFDGSSLGVSITITIANPGVVTWTAHGLSNGRKVMFTTNGALPTGLLPNVIYFVVNASTNTFQVSATSGGAAINTTGTQSGSHTGHVTNTTDSAGIVASTFSNFETAAGTYAFSNVISTGWNRGLYMTSVYGATISGGHYDGSFAALSFAGCGRVKIIGVDLEATGADGFDTPVYIDSGLASNDSKYNSVGLNRNYTIEDNSFTASAGCESEISIVSQAATDTISGVTIRNNRKLDAQVLATPIKETLGAGGVISNIIISGNDPSTGWPNDADPLLSANNTWTGSQKIENSPTADGSMFFDEEVWSTQAYNVPPVAGIRFVFQKDSSNTYSSGGGITVAKSNATDGNYASYVALHARDNGQLVTERYRAWISGAYNYEQVGGASGLLRVSGAGSPEGAVAAPVGSLFVRSDGGTGTTLYIKETGAGNTGWVAGVLTVGGGATIAVTAANLKGDGAGNAVAVTATGTGDTVLATSPTLVTPTIGVATATSVNKWALTAPSTAATLTAGADGLTYTLPEITTKIGFRHIPQNSQSAPYTTVLNDSGKHIYHPASDANNRTFTIDSNANVAYPIGTAIMFVNLSANNLSIAITADTMYLAGAGTTGTRTLAQYGKATAVKTGTTEWVIAGVGLS